MAHKVSAHFSLSPLPWVLQPCWPLSSPNKKSMLTLGPSYMLFLCLEHCSLHSGAGRLLVEESARASPRRRAGRETDIHLFINSFIHFSLKLTKLVPAPGNWHILFPLLEPLSSIHSFSSAWYSFQLQNQFLWVSLRPAEPLPLESSAQIHYSIAMWPQASDLISPCLSLFICQMKIRIVLISWGCFEIRSLS